MVKFFIYILIILTTLTTFLNTKTIDESRLFFFKSDVDKYEKLLNDTPESKKSFLYNNFVYIHNNMAYVNENINKKILKYAEEALKYSQKFNLEDQYILALSNIALAYSLNKTKTETIKAIKICENNLKKIKKKNVLIIILENIGTSYSIMKNNKLEINYLKKMEKISEEIGHIKEAWSYYLMSMFYYKTGETKLKLKYTLKSLNLYKKHNVKEGIILLMGAYGRALEYRGENLKALKKYLEALELGKNDYNENIRHVLSIIYFYLGKYYKNVKNYKEALNNLHIGVEIIKDLNIPHLKYHTYNSIGDILTITGKYDKALEILNKALKINREESSKGDNMTSGILLNIGRVYFKKDEYDNAIKYYNQAETLINKFNEVYFKGRFFKYKGELCIKLDQLEKARQYFLKSLEIIKKTNETQLIIENYLLMSELHERLNTLSDLKKSLQYIKEYIKLNNKINNKNKIRERTELEKKIEMLQKEMENEKLKAQNEIHLLKLKNRKTFNIALICALLFLITVFFIMIKKYRHLLIFWKKHTYFGQYRILEKIATGGFGNICKCHPVKDRKKILAIKRLNELYSADEKEIQRFKQEGEIIDNLNHPNIVSVYERGELNDRLYYIMEYLEGENLSERAKKKKFTLKEIIHIIIQITDALQLVHEKDIIHRDIKSSNIVMIEKGNDKNFVKLLDFGIAKLIKKSKIEQTATGEQTGSPPYMSPEQYEGKKVTFKSDIYSLGLIFYGLVTDLMVEDRQELESVVEDRETNFEDPIIKNPDLPPEINDLITEMIDYNPEKRPDAKTLLLRIKECE